jgi:hypothetical protein
MMTPLSHYIAVHRRYTRSVNLERDLEIRDSVLGYVPTPKAIYTIGRFLESFLTPYSTSAWTLTGVYGTGKSAFAHFLSALCAPDEEQIRVNALRIAETIKSDEQIYKVLESNFPESGLVRAVATAQREPITHTVIRALYRGASLFWRNTPNNTKPQQVLSKLKALTARITKRERFDDQTVLALIQEVAQVSNTGVLLIIDELGKNLEFATQNQEADDLFLLQRITELPSRGQAPRVFVFGLLHQSFADYAHGLMAIQRNEWGKVQGRFEDIPFAESPEQVMRLVNYAIDQTAAKPILPSIYERSKEWQKALEHNDNFKGFTVDSIRLHISITSDFCCCSTNSM